MKNKPRILSTKILSQALSDKIHDSGFDLVQIDFIDIVKMKAQKKIDNQAVMISSKNAANFLDLNGRDIFCVGQKTKFAIEANDVQVSKVFSDSQEMALYVASKYKTATFICGMRRMNRVQEVFQEMEVELQIIEAYDTLLTPSAVPGYISKVLFFSPSGVESFFLDNSFDGTAICIGNTTRSEVLKYIKDADVSNSTTIESVVEKALETRI